MSVRSSAVGPFSFTTLAHERKPSEISTKWRVAITAEGACDTDERSPAIADHPLKVVVERRLCYRSMGVCDVDVVLLRKVSFT